jgi:Flp pilus assembly protein TadB
MTRQPDEYYLALEERLQALDPLVAAVTPDVRDEFREYLQHGEYGLAVETVAEGLLERVPSDDRSLLAKGLLAEARTMGLEGHRVDDLETVLRT